MSDKTILLDNTTLEPCPTRGNLMCTITDKDHLHRFSHMVAHDLAMKEATIRKLQEEIERYREMCGQIDMANLLDGNEIWRLSDSDWMNGMSPKVFKTPVEAYEALKETQ